MLKARINRPAMLGVLCVALCCAYAQGAAAAGIQSRTLKADNFTGFTPLPCGWPRANCVTSNPDCETNLLTSGRHCGKCGNNCGINGLCVDGICLPYRCSLVLLPGGRPCPAGFSCKLGVCVKDAVQCSTVKRDSGTIGTFSYVVNVGSCIRFLNAREAFKFQYNANDVPVQFTLKHTNGTILYGPVVVGSGRERCSNSLHCIGNPYGTACPVPPIPLYPNVPLSGPGVFLFRPTDDTRVIVEVKALCSNSKWEFQVGCVLLDCIRKR